MQKIRRRKIGEILLSEGLCSHDQLQTALERQRETGEAVGEILMHESVVTENDIVRAICIQYQLPFIRPSCYQITSTLLARFTPEFLFQNRLVPLDEIGTTFIVALGEIPTEAVEAQIKGRLGQEVFFYFAPVSEVEALLKQQFGFDQEQVVALNAQRLKLNKGAHAGPGSKPDEDSDSDHGSLLETLDSSWEAIFDEAEQNLG